MSASLQERMEAVDILHVFMCTCLLCGCPGLHDFVKMNQLLFFFFVFVLQSVAQEAPIDLKQRAGKAGVEERRV